MKENVLVNHLEKELGHAGCLTTYFLQIRQLEQFM